MKFLLVSDLHYALKQYDWATAVARNFDVVVIAGDHLDISGHVDGGVQIVVILKYLKRLMACAQIVVSSGNHDLDVRNADGEKVALWMNRVRQMGIPTDGDSIALGGILITICPWWDGPNAKRSVQALIERDAKKQKETWIWVYHAPPQVRRQAGTVSSSGATPNWWLGSSPTRPTSFLPGTSIRRPSRRVGRGPIGSVRHGCSTAVSRLDRRQRT